MYSKLPTETDSIQFLILLNNIHAERLGLCQEIKVPLYLACWLWVMVIPRLILSYKGRRTIHMQFYIEY